MPEALLPVSEGSVWWPVVVGAINFDGLIVLDIAIEPRARR